MVSNILGINEEYFESLTYRAFKSVSTYQPVDANDYEEYSDYHANIV